MSIRPDEVRRVADLARLRLAPEELERLAAELSAVLDFAETLNALDLDGCEPSTLAPADAPWRDDEPNGRRLTAEQATAGAPEAEDGFFLVPPVVENVNP
jgi:aspartyl-tRNA(Asn)/glutamyl-tRNA(Gln) amidotransferase subunit C